jgi:hypothetical protein
VVSAFTPKAAATSTPSVRPDFALLNLSHARVCESFLSETHSPRAEQKTAPRNIPIYLNNCGAKMIRVDIAFGI